MQYQSIIAAAGLSVASTASGSVTMQFICDNDFALLAGTSTGVTRILWQNNVEWNQQIAQAASFNVELEAGETMFYLLALGGGYVENIGGTINGVDVTSQAVGAEKSSDIAPSLTGYLSSFTELGGNQSNLIAYGTYNVQLGDVQAALPSVTWTTNTNAGPGGVGSNVTGTAFHFESKQAILYRFSAGSVGVVPGPGAIVLLGATGLIAGRRRRV